MKNGDKNIESLNKRIQILEDELKFAQSNSGIFAESWKQTLDSIDDIVYQTNENFEIVDINKAGIEYFGFPKSEIIGKKCHEIMHGSNKPIEYCPHVKARISKKTESVVHFDKLNGKWYLIKSSPINSPNLKTEYFVDIITDITDQKLFEKKLLESEQKANKNLDNLKFLADTAYKFVSKKYGSNIYKFIGNCLHKLNPDSMILVNSVDSKANSLVTEMVIGAKGRLEKIISVMGDNPIRKTYKPDKTFQQLKSGKIEKLDGGLFELSFGKIPKVTCKLLEKILDVDKIYSIAALLDEEIFANVVFIFPVDADIQNIETTEAFIKQAAVSIKNEKIEKELAESLHEKELITASIPSIIYKADIEADGKFSNTYMSEAVDDFLGLPPNTINNDWEKFFSYVLPEYIPQLMNKVKYAYANKGKIISSQFEIQKNDNSHAWILTNARAVEEGDTVKVYGFATDITHRVKAARALRVSEEKYRILSENVSDGVLLIEYNQLKYISQGYKKLLGYQNWELEDLTTGGLFSFIHDDDKSRIKAKLIDAHKNLWEEYNFQYRIKKKSGEFIWVEDFVTSQYGDDNVRIRSVIHSRDITERIQYEKLLEKQKLELEKLNATKDKFFSIIAHDLRNPFNVILGASDLLLKIIDLGNKEDLLFCAETINKSAENTYYLLENLLEWSKAQRGDVKFFPESINIEILIASALSVSKKMAQSKEIRIDIKLKDELYIYADRRMAEFILRNLFTNAIKFTKRNGKIEISAERKKDEVVLKVADNGIGISKEKIETLFDIAGDPATRGTENELGSGLGLTLCKEFIQKHNGDIWVESEEGKGSTFICTFPKYKKDSNQ